jgi:hypothetical protein
MTQQQDDDERDSEHGDPSWLRIRQFGEQFEARVA